MWISYHVSSCQRSSIIMISDVISMKLHTSSQTCQQILCLVAAAAWWKIQPQDTTWLRKKWMSDNLIDFLPPMEMPYCSSLLQLLDTTSLVNLWLQPSMDHGNLWFSRNWIYWYTNSQPFSCPVAGLCLCWLVKYLRMLHTLLVWSDPQHRLAVVSTTGHLARMHVGAHLPIVCSKYAAGCFLVLFGRWCHTVFSPNWALLSSVKIEFFCSAFIVYLALISQFKSPRCSWHDQ